MHMGHFHKSLSYSQGPVDYRICCVRRPLRLRTKCVTQVWSRRLSNTMIDLFQRALEQEISLFSNETQAIKTTKVCP